MGFKFKKGKDKKSKKKKKGSKSKEEWNFEGGTGLTGQEQPPKRRSSTQERDDRMSRVRSMQEDKKRRLEASEKMSKKVKFSDILACQPSDDTADDEQHETEMEEEREIKRQRPTNPHPAAYRLQSLLMSKLASEQKQLTENRQAFQSRANVHSNSSTHTTIDTSDIQNTPADHRSSKPSKSVAYELTFGDLQSAGHTVDDTEVVGDEYDSDAEDKIASSSSASALQSWMFNQDLDVYNAIYNINRKKDYLKQTVGVSVGVEGTLTTHLHPHVSPLVNKLSSSLHSVQDIPGLNKLWKTGKTPLTPFARTYLPPLLSYADLFLEGRDFSNDEVIRETVLMHGIFHVLQAR
ncbi:hypothetical protein EON65_14260 [archaeon]|nr:MAG: hypothetical protein EON65_14260 [archaeon]